MKNKYGRTKAQSTIEYAMVIACLIAALIGMQIYIKRGIQGRVKSAADEIGDQYSATTTTSSLTQSITNPNPVNITGNTVIRNITWVNRNTGEVHQNEPVELMEVTRNEQTVVNIQSGSYEQTGRLSDENLFH